MKKSPITVKDSEACCDKLRTANKYLFIFEFSNIIWYPWRDTSHCRNPDRHPAQKLIGCWSATRTYRHVLTPLKTVDMKCVRYSSKITWCSELYYFPPHLASVIGRLNARDNNLFVAKFIQWRHWRRKICGFVHDRGMFQGNLEAMNII